MEDIGDSFIHLKRLARLSSHIDSTNKNPAFLYPFQPC